MNIEPRKGFEASAVALRAMARLAAVGRPTSRGRYGGHAGAYIRYCETNPPFWKAIFYVSFVFRNTYIVCRPGLQVGSFWKTNPPGRVFRGVFTEKWVHIGSKVGLFYLEIQVASLRTPHLNPLPYT